MEKEIRKLITDIMFVHGLSYGEFISLSNYEGCIESHKDYADQQSSSLLKQNEELKAEIRHEAILFGKYLANTVNTERWDEEAVEKEAPKLYEDYLSFCGRPESPNNQNKEI